MHIFRLKHLAIGCGMLLLAACSSGSSGPSSTLSVTSKDPSTGTQKTFTATTGNAVMTGTTNTTENTTMIQMCGDVDADNDCSQLMIMKIDGTSAGTYTIDSVDSASSINYHDDKNQEAGDISHYISDSGVINITKVGNAGEPVAGDFSAIVECNSGCTGTTTVSGTFSVILSK